MQIHSIERLHQLQGHKGAVYTLCDGIDPETILSGGSDGFICKWEPNQNKNGIVIADVGTQVFSLYSFPEKKIVFAGTMQGDLYHFNFQDESLVRRFKFHQQSIYRFAEWNEMLIVAAGDGIVSIWNPDTAEMIHHLKISHQKLRSLAIDPENDKLFTGDANGNLWILKLPGLELIEKLESVHDKTIFSMKYLDAEKLLLTGGLDAHLKILNDTANIIQDIKAHWFSVNDICNLRGTNFIATASRDKSIRIWDKSDRSLVKEISSPKFAAHLHSVNSLLWNSNKSVLYSASDDGNIFGWGIRM
jgi:WD40 repeat protein